MANLEVIWDNVALQSKGVAGVKDAYGSGAGSVSGVVGVPQDFADWPVAEVIYSGSTITPSSWQQLQHNFSIRLWTSSAEAADAVLTLAPMLERFLAAFQANYDLNGTCKQAVVVGSTGIAPDTINQKPFVYMDILLEVKVERTATYTP